MKETLYDFQAKTIAGADFDFSSLKGKPVLVVNTASNCGFTPQYKGLETLYKSYKDKGLTIVAFPCDQFAHQEPGSDSEIAAACERNFGVTFPLMAKIEVNGAGTHPLFGWLKKKAPGVIGSAIKWNFTKFLIEKDGKTVTRFAPSTEPDALVADIEKAL